MILHYDMTWANTFAEGFIAFIWHVIDRPIWAACMAVFILAGIFLWRRRR